ncbi:hypothetical protein LXL04_021485 [Taraxacum kok-saghyz]
MYRRDPWGGPLEINNADSATDDDRSRKLNDFDRATLSRPLDETQKSWLRGPGEQKKKKYVDLGCIIVSRKIFVWTVGLILAAGFIVGFIALIVKTVPRHHKHPLLLIITPLHFKKLSSSSMPKNVVDVVYDCKSEVIGLVSFDIKFYWIPGKDNIFIWTLSQGRMAVRQKLAEMKINVPNTMCKICGEEEESIRHLFFECDVAIWLWMRMSLWCKSVIPMFEGVDDVIAWADQNFVDKNRCKIVIVIAVAVLRSIWNHRNEAIFNSKKSGKEECLRRMQEMSYHWLSTRSRVYMPDLNSWKCNSFYNS